MIDYDRVRDDPAGLDLEARPLKLRPGEKSRTAEELNEELEKEREGCQRDTNSSTS